VVQLGERHGDGAHRGPNVRQIRDTAAPPDRPRWMPGLAASRSRTAAAMAQIGDQQAALAAGAPR
jgi:hypothetical protein